MVQEMSICGSPSSYIHYDIPGQWLQKKLHTTKLKEVREYARE